VTRRRARICWGTIVGSWIAGNVFDVLTWPRLDKIAAAPHATPPTWVVAAGCAFACLLAVVVANRRVRACLRLRPRLSRPSVHGDTYLEAFVLRTVLDVVVLLATWALVRFATRGYWSDWVSIMFEVAGRLPDAAAITYVFLRVRSVRIPLAEWGWRRGNGVLRELPIGVLAGILVWLVWQLGDTVRGPGDAYRFQTSISSIVVAPIIEETIYRGALYRYMRDRMSWLPAVIFSSTVFAAMHTTYQMPFVYVSGLVYGLLREWRGSLTASIAAHASWNALAIAAGGLWS
jgi:membrane protease YdiL (CAAX protease family)